MYDEYFNKGIISTRSSNNSLYLKHREGSNDNSLYFRDTVKQNQDENERLRTTLIENSEN